MADRREAESDAAAPKAGEADRDSWSELLLIPLWIGLFMGLWWGVDRLLVLAPRALQGFPAVRAGARSLVDAREVIAPILAMLFAAYALALLGAVRRRLRGEPWCGSGTPERAPARPRSGVPRALRDASAIARIERELDRAKRAERGAVRRAALSVNDRIMLGVLRRHRASDNDIGCLGIIVILVAATIALPLAAAAAARLVGFDLDGRLASLLWFVLAFGGFSVRNVWARRQAEAVAPHDTRG